LDNAPTPRFPTCEEEDGPELTDLQEARLAGLADGRSVRTGAAPRYKEQFEPAFNELANRWLEGWKAAPGRRPSNTGSQYAAAIRLFHEFWGDRPLRGVTQRDAAEFVELLKRLPPNHGRGQLSGVSLEDAVELWVGKGPGLSTPSIKRHLGVLKQVWAWGKPLGYCTGEDPFQVKLMKHRKKPSLGWETPDLQRLFADPPRRRDIYEAFYIAMFTGLRVHEIADLTWGQVRTEQGVDYLLIQDAKTEAGSRKVPVHSRLSWLLRKPRGDDTDPVFPTFSPEGPRRSRGGDASKLFGAWKKKLGVAPRRYVFHSARKNVTRIMEENAIPANVWARIIGHEPGFTYSVYNPAGLSFQNAKKTIELIDYPDVSMPSPEELYGDEARLKKAA
jgi:integrase